MVMLEERFEKGRRPLFGLEPPGGSSGAAASRGESLWVKVR